MNTLSSSKMKEKKIAIKRIAIDKAKFYVCSPKVKISDSERSLVTSKVA